MTVEPVRPQDASGIYRRNVARAAEAAQERAQQGRRPGAARRSDQIALSDEARGLRAALEVVDAQPEVRAELVAEVRRQIQDGAYGIDAREIARRLLARGA